MSLLLTYDELRAHGHLQDVLLNEVKKSPYTQEDTCGLYYAELIKGRNGLDETKEVGVPFLHPESIMKIITIIKFFVMYGLQIKNKIVSLHLKN